MVRRDGMKKKKKVEMFDICNVIFMFAVLFITIYPLYFTVIASFSEPSAVATGKVLWRPVGFTLDSYRQVFAYAAGMVRNKLKAVPSTV